MKISKLLELLLDRDIDVLTIKHDNHYDISCTDSSCIVILAVTGVNLKQAYSKLADKLIQQQIKQLNKPSSQKLAKCI